MQYDVYVRLRTLESELETLKFQLIHAKERMAELKQRPYAEHNKRQRNQFISRLNSEINGFVDRITLLEAECADLKER